GIDNVVSDGTNGSLSVKPQGNGLYIETNEDFIVSGVTGVIVAKGHGTTYIPSLSDGMYIVSSGRAVVKVML
ncbi:MAG: hypothetical protein K2M98_04730, partial [Muribaculum sp.]|nr:hypothetical protein [Muribaculum sp.]